MRSIRLLSTMLVVGLMASAASLAAQVPAGATGVCGDGTYTTAKTKSGACSNHGGVKTWYATQAPAAAPAPTPAKTAPAPKLAAKPAGATGMCGDGTYTTAKTKSGACSNHGGVKDWYAAAAPVAAAPAPTPKPAPAAKVAPAAKAAPAAAPAPAIKVAPIAGAPAAATALCNDGTYSESQHRSGTCSNHKGVKQWLKNIPPQ